MYHTEVRLSSLTCVSGQRFIMDSCKINCYYLRQGDCVLAVAGFFCLSDCMYVCLLAILISNILRDQCIYMYSLQCMSALQAILDICRLTKLNVCPVVTMQRSCWRLHCRTASLLILHVLGASSSSSRLLPLSCQPLHGSISHEAVLTIGHYYWYCCCRASRIRLSNLSDRIWKHSLP